MHEASGSNAYRMLIFAFLCLSALVSQKVYLHFSQLHHCGGPQTLPQIPDQKILKQDYNCPDISLFLHLYKSTQRQGTLVSNHHRIISMKLQRGGRTGAYWEINSTNVSICYHNIAESLFLLYLRVQMGGQQVSFYSVAPQNHPLNSLHERNCGRSLESFQGPSLEVVNTCIYLPLFRLQNYA